MKDNYRKTATRCSLALATAVCFGGAGAVSAAQPCPWQDTERSEDCAEWDAMAQRLDTAEARAKAAESELQAVEDKGFTPEARADASPEEARARAIIDRILENYTSPVPEIKFDFERDYDLTKDGAKYQAVLPKFDLIIDEGRIGFGPLSFGITPGEGGLSTIDFRMGDAITFSENGQALGRLTIGEQIGQGIWDESLQYFASAQGRMTQISLDMPEEPVTLELSSLDYGLNLNRNDDDQWQYDQSLVFGAIKFAAEGNSIDVGGLSGKFDISGRDYQKIMGFAAQIRTVIEENKDKLAAAEDDPEAVRPFLDAFGEMYATITQFDGKLEADQLSIAQGGQPLGSIDRLAVGYDYGEGDSGSELRYSLELGGLQTAMAPVPPTLLPKDARFVFGLRNLPPDLFQQFIEMGMESEPLSEAEQEAYWNQKLLELVMTRQIGAFIEDTFIAADDARVDLNLDAAANPGSALGGVGEITLRIENMQKVVDGAGLSSDPSVAPVLAMITAFSNRTEEDGNVVDTFDLQVAPDGKLMLNNKDITAMVMPGAAPPPAEGEKTE